MSESVDYSNRKFKEEELRSAIRKAKFESRLVKFSKVVGMFSIFGFTVCLMILLNISQEALGSERDLITGMLLTTGFLLLWSIAGTMIYKSKKEPGEKSIAEIIRNE